MKKYIYILLVVILFSACERILDIKPTSSLSYNGFWDNEEGAMSAHAGLYEALRSYAGTIWGLGELRSDIWGGVTIESPYNIYIIEQDISISKVPYSNWAGFYSLIHKLNDFIQNVPDIDFRNDTEKNHLIAEAYGIRAYIYFTMLKTWGKVPISTQAQVAINPAQLSLSRSTEVEVMDLIKSDINKSIEYFNNDESFWKAKRFYWSQLATLTLKGEVYIWSGKHLGGGANDYTQAKSALSKVISNSNVKLLDNYADIFAYNNKNNQELIFSINYEIDQATNFYGSFTGRGAEIHPMFDENGNSLNDLVVNGANRYGVTEKILLILDDINDSRRNATLLRMYKDNKIYTNYNKNAYTGSILKKFFGMVDAGSRKMVDDIPIFRIADAILLLAEAKNNLGEDPSAEINLVRKRAYGDKFTAALNYVNSNKDDNTNAILNERLKEFVGEGKRWWDLRRAGNKFVFANNEYLKAGDEYKLLLPISLDMIGRNPALKQTKGY